MTVRHNQSGYCGSSRSTRAAEAERNGKLPLSRAIKAFAGKAGITHKRAREALLAVGSCEWHHVSKYANPVDYYSLTAAIRWLELRRLV